MPILRGKHSESVHSGTGHQLIHQWHNGRTLGDRQLAESRQAESHALRRRHESTLDINETEYLLRHIALISVV